MSLEEFEYATKVDNAELVTLDHLVLDVKDFKAKHPGGSALIHLNVGRDMGCYFVGSYT